MAHTKMIFLIGTLLAIGSVFRPVVSCGLNEELGLVREVAELKKELETAKAKIAKLEEFTRLPVFEVLTDQRLAKVIRNVNKSDPNHRHVLHLSDLHIGGKLSVTQGVTCQGILYTNYFEKRSGLKALDGGDIDK